jgi:hypothetical protein
VLLQQLLGVLPLLHLLVVVLPQGLLVLQVLLLVEDYSQEWFAVEEFGMVKRGKVYQNKLVLQQQQRKECVKKFLLLLKEDWR